MQRGRCQLSNSAAGTKHFLDTSVARPLIHGSKFYKDYLSQHIPGKRYVSDYVLMEFRRGFIMACIEVYADLYRENVTTPADAMAVTSSRGSSRDRAAAILLLKTVLESNNDIDWSDPAGMPIAQREFARAILRFDARFRAKFTDASQGRTHCSRAKTELDIDTGNYFDGFKSFVKEFDDKQTHRSRCHIDKVLLSDYRSEVDAAIKKMQEIIEQRQKTANSGFVDVAKQLEVIREKNGTNCTCDTCAKVGDAVIAFDAPRSMRLEHTDHSYDQLCGITGQQHQKHSPEITVAGKSSFF